MSRWSYETSDGDRLSVGDGDSAVVIYASTPVASVDLDEDEYAVAVFNLTPAKARELAEWLEIYARAADPTDAKPVPTVKIPLDQLAREIRVRRLDVGSAGNEKIAAGGPISFGIYMRRACGGNSEAFLLEAQAEWDHDLGMINLRPPGVSVAAPGTVLELSPWEIVQAGNKASFEFERR